MGRGLDKTKITDLVPHCYVVAILTALVKDAMILSRLHSALRVGNIPLTGNHLIEISPSSERLRELDG